VSDADQEGNDAKSRQKKPAASFDLLAGSGFFSISYSRLLLSLDEPLRECPDYQRARLSASLSKNASLGGNRKGKHHLNRFLVSQFLL
jgi:hypothetical protein